MKTTEETTEFNDSDTELRLDNELNEHEQSSIEEDSYFIKEDIREVKKKENNTVEKLFNYILEGKIDDSVSEIQKQYNQLKLMRETKEDYFFSRHKYLKEHLFASKKRIKRLKQENKEILDYLNLYDKQIDVYRKCLEKKINKLEKRNKVMDKVVNKILLNDIKIVNSLTAKLPVIKNKEHDYNNRENILKLINSGRIKGNNMKFFGQYGYKNWKEVRNKQIKQKNILPLINK